MVLLFYAGIKQYKKAFYKEWIFFYAYCIYYSLFNIGTEIKS
jgi:hypothetical protein